MDKEAPEKSEIFWFADGRTWSLVVWTRTMGWDIVKSEGNESTWRKTNNVKINLFLIINIVRPWNPEIGPSSATKFGNLSTDDIFTHKCKSIIRTEALTSINLQLHQSIKSHRQKRLVRWDEKKVRPSIKVKIFPNFIKVPIKCIPPWETSPDVMFHLLNKTGQIQSKEDQLAYTCNREGLCIKINGP